MRISAALAERAASDEAGAEHLIRATLAHEAAHVLLHRIRFLQQSEAPFGREASRQELCRDIRAVGRGYTGESWERQANRGMGALLLPRSEVIDIAGPWTVAALRDGQLVRSSPLPGQRALRLPPSSSITPRPRPGGSPASTRSSCPRSSL